MMMWQEKQKEISGKVRGLITGLTFTTITG
nr:MAG TPA: hypothetical protein [Caudoviricetes sp.]